MKDGFQKMRMKIQMRMKIITPNRALIRLLILLASMIAGISYKLKNDIKQILYLLSQHNKTTKTLYKKLIYSL